PGGPSPASKRTGWRFLFLSSPMRGRGAERREWCGFAAPIACHVAARAETPLRRLAPRSLGARLPALSPLSRAMANCPLGVTSNGPILGITQERANERGTNHGKPVVERSTGAGDEDAGRRGGDVAAEGVRVGAEADRAAAGLQPSHGEGLRGGGRGEAV